MRGSVVATALIAMVSSGTVRPVASRRPVPAAVTLRVIATTDFHGALEARPDASGALRGGAAAMATAIHAAEQTCQPPACVSVIVDGGDLFQGTAASNLAFGRPVVEIYDAIGYAASALGNHEFDWGQDTLRALMHAAHFRMLGANVRYADGQDVEWIPNDTVVERAGVRIGIIGVATRQTPTTTRAPNVAGLRFDDPAPIVDSIAAALRARGVGAVVLTAHMGGSCASNGDCQGEILDLVGKLHQHVDAVVAGHSHVRLSTAIGGVPVVEARSSGLAVATIDVPLTPAAPPAERVVREIYADSVAPSPLVKPIVDRAVARVAPLVARPIARIAEPMPKQGSEYALGDLIADGMRVVGRGDIGLMNNGGIRRPLAAGAATYGDLFEIQPFGNVLYRVRLNGRDLRAYFERVLRRGAPNFHVSGVRIVYHTTPAPAGIDSLVVGGARVDDRTVYTMVVNDFSLEGGDNLGFAGLAVTSEPADLVDLDALIAYLRSLPQPVAPPAGQRIVNRSRG